MANSTFRITVLLAFCIATALPAWADGAGQRERLALQTCLTAHPEAEHLCFDIPFYTCMGEQLTVAANPELAEERCLFQEQFVWGILVDEACEDLSMFFEKGTAEWDEVCFENNSPNWGHLTQGINQPTWDRGFSNQSLRISAQGIRSFAVQIRLLIKAHRTDQ